MFHWNSRIPGFEGLRFECGKWVVECKFGHFLLSTIYPPALDPLEPLVPTLKHYPGSPILFQDSLSSEILTSNDFQCDIEYEPQGRESK
jgi:hypothetical protein